MTQSNTSSSVGPKPGSSPLAPGNLTGSARLAEKTIELTTCAQIAAALSRPMVWFGLTQAQERKYGFDAATDLGGTAFILQFKASSTVIQSGTYAGQRRFLCQHQQMNELVTRFGSVPNACFYFFPSVGTFADLQAVSGNLLDNSFLVDVADLPRPVPASGRASDYHYVYLDKKTPAVTITSKPFHPSRVVLLRDFIAKSLIEGSNSTTKQNQFNRLQGEYRRENSAFADAFFKNAALVVVPD